MQPVKYFQEGGVLDASFYGFDPEEYEPLTQEEYDQQEADYYGISVDELRNFRQQQAGIGGLPAAQERDTTAKFKIQLEDLKKINAELTDAVQRCSVCGVCNYLNHIKRSRPSTTIIWFRWRRWIYTRRHACSRAYLF